MPDFHFVFNERAERFFSATGSDAEAFDFEFETQEAVLCSAFGSALSLDIPGAAAFVAPLNEERCVVFCLRQISDGLEAIVCGIDPYPADRHPQVDRRARRC